VNVTFFGEKAAHTMRFSPATKASFAAQISRPAR